MEQKRFDKKNTKWLKSSGIWEIYIEQGGSVHGETG